MEYRDGWRVDEWIEWTICCSAAHYHTVPLILCKKTKIIFYFHTISFSSVTLNWEKVKKRIYKTLFPSLNFSLLFSPLFFSVLTYFLSPQPWYLNENTLVNISSSHLATLPSFSSQILMTTLGVLYGTVRRVRSISLQHLCLHFHFYCSNHVHHRGQQKTVRTRK